MNAVTQAALSPKSAGELPTELQPFFAQQAIPPSVLMTIREGWEKMLPIGRLRLLERLEREKTPGLRVLMADLAAAKVLLDMAEKPARDLADNILLMGKPASRRHTRAINEAGTRMEYEGGRIILEDSLGG